MVRTATAITTVIAALSLCWINSPLSFAQAPQPKRRVSGLKAVTMEQKLTHDIAEAKRTGRDVSEAEKLKAQGDAALSEGELRSATKSYAQAEKALGSDAK